MLYWTQVVHPARASPSFCCMEWLGVLLLPPEWDASLLQSNPPVFHQALLTICQYPFILLVEREAFKRKVSCQTTQENDQAKSRNQNSRHRIQHINHWVSSPFQPILVVTIRYYKSTRITPIHPLQQAEADALIDHFAVVYSVAKPLIWIEAEGDRIVIEASI